MKDRVIEMTDIRQLVNLVSDIPDGVVIQLELEGEADERDGEPVQT